jgi:hypothetical protein
MDDKQNVIGRRLRGALAGELGIAHAVKRPVLSATWPVLSRGCAFQRPTVVTMVDGRFCAVETDCSWA